MCDRCEELDLRCQALEDECTRWRLFVDPTGLIPQGAAGRNLRMVLRVNRIRRHHMQTLRQAAHHDSTLTDIVTLLEDLTGL